MLFDLLDSILLLLAIGLGLHLVQHVCDHGQIHLGVWHGFVDSGPPAEGVKHVKKCDGDVDEDDQRE